MNNDIAGNVLITGGTSGIGFASAQKFAESGTPKIAINGRNEERGMVALEKLRKSWPKTECKLVLADVTISSEVTKAAFSKFSAYGIGTSFPVQFNTGASR